jgi:hypothetical protein
MANTTPMLLRPDDVGMQYEDVFFPELKHLHDAGYNILTYELATAVREARESANAHGATLPGLSRPR